MISFMRMQKSVLTKGNGSRRNNRCAEKRITEPIKKDKRYELRQMSRKAESYPRSPIWYCFTRELPIITKTPMCAS